MDFAGELFRYHSWATVQLIDFCSGQPPALLDEPVIGTDRSILHTMTHIVGTEQWYLELLTGERAAKPVLRAQALDLADLRQRFLENAPRWEDLLERFEQIDITLPANEWRSETPHGQNVLILQAIQHGIDHRAQISTTLAARGAEPPIIDGWFYWAATHPGAPSAQGIG
ncbi:MAG TPA: DinB family protein, partial [Roseiflexaceae bacterium]|nr:DinB family protein [Roseiflexaceae bacterium]